MDKEAQNNVINPEKLSEEQYNVLKNISPRAMEETEKTFTTGYETNPAEQQGGSALRMEELSSQVSLLTFSEADLDFFNLVPREKAQTTVVQYTVQTDHGGSGPQRFVSEVDISNVTDPHLRKKSARMKFLSDTKRQSIANQIAGTLIDPTRLLTEDAIINIAKTIEWAAFYGDADLSADPEQGSGLQFDGLSKLIDPDNVLDVRGGALTEGLINQASTIVGKGYGTPTDAFMPIGVQTMFLDQYLDRQVQIISSNSNNTTLGYNVQTFNSVRGPINLHGSTIMELDNVLDEKRLTANTASPLPPQVQAKPVTGVRGLFNGEDDLTDYRYRVVSQGDTASRPSDVVTAAVSNASDGVQLDISLNGMYQQSPQYVSVYRQGKEQGEFWLIGNVPVSASDGGVISFVDRNETIPETSDVFIGEMSQSVISLFEFLPMTKIPMAQVDATLTFTVLWYGALALKAPRKWVQIKNVKSVNVRDPHNIHTNDARDADLYQDIINQRGN